VKLTAGVSGIIILLRFELFHSKLLLNFYNLSGKSIADLIPSEVNIKSYKRKNITRLYFDRIVIYFVT